MVARPGGRRRGCTDSRMADQGKRQRAVADSRAIAHGQEDGVDRAFDIWLQRGLHQLYDQVAREPLPEELLRLIEEDRNRSAGRKE